MTTHSEIVSKIEKLGFKWIRQIDDTTYLSKRCKGGRTLLVQAEGERIADWKDFAEFKAWVKDSA
jgi:hypothetical protein